MATIVGFTSKREIYLSGTFNRPVDVPVGTETGDILIAAIVIGTNGPIVAPSGWNILRAGMSFGTRAWTVFSQVYDSEGDPPSFDFVTSSGTRITISVVSVRGVDYSTKIVGATWQRNVDGTGSSDKRTIGKGIDCTSDGVVISLHGEATLAVETADPYVTMSFGEVVGVGDFQGGVASQDIEKVMIASSIVPGPGVTPDHVATWQNAAQNGVATSIFFPNLVSETQPVGNVEYASVPYFTQDELRVGISTFNSDKSYTATISGTDETVDVDLNATTCWGTARFTGLTPGTEYTVTISAGDVVQTDIAITATTMPSGPSSFKALAGSCQATGSNHYIFQRMQEEEALFLGHMGDLHYENAYDEPGWRAGVNTSMTSARMRAMIQTLPMNWQWDNHDRIIIDNLNLGTTDVTTVTEYRNYAGGDGWPTDDTNARTWTAGRVRFIQTDFWTVRDDPDLVSEPRTMLGADQKQWLKDTLAAAKEPIIVWLNQWPGTIYGNGRWGSFTAETREIESWINARPGIRARLILIGGDSHTLLADSGTRSGNGHFLNKVPNLNISGFRQSNTEVGAQSPAWDIAQRTLQDDPLTESVGKYGGYSRMTVEDDGFNISFLWEGVRVDSDGNSVVLATYERKLATVEIDGEPCTVWGYDSTKGRVLPLTVEFGVPTEFPNGLEAQWTFDEGTDDIITGRSLAVTGVSLASGRGGQVLAAGATSGTADGEDGFLNLDGFTIEAWILTPTSLSYNKVSFLAGTTVVAEIYSGWRLLSTDVYHLTRVTARIGGSLKNVGKQVIEVRNSAVAPAQVWRHVAGVFDGAGLHLYIDGVEFGTGTAYAGVVDDPDSFSITLEENGAVDDVAIWSKPLTAAEVLARYTEGV